jgi:hypothetical protein
LRKGYCGPESDEVNGDEENYMRRFIICTLHKIFWGSEIKEHKLGRICSTHGEYEKFFKNFP